MNQDNFIPRKFKNEKSTNSISFEEVINNSSISIILGEPASGKTYQLENYDSLNQNSICIELITIDDEDDIEENIEIVLLDSIDEALSKNDSDKILVRKLIKYIKRCKAINPNVKFVISCRYVEWKEIFENKLEEIDKEFQVYSIEELNQEDIDLLLMNNSVNKDDFWNFIKSNYLEQLLKNILMTIHIIENFNNYRDRELKYIDIYKEIIEEHLLAETDNERKKQLKEIGLVDMIKISSIIAIYMTLNRTRTISIEHINRLAKEFYQLDKIEITGKKLEIVFDTALFSGNRNSIRFFHKSVQEYLTAYFIDLKQLDMETIKKIFSHNMGFYEEFEEVIIYLTNIESRFFKYFVEFDPFIFRRHPYLSEDEQRNLFISMLKLLDTNEQRGWTRWEYIENSSLCKFPLLSKSIVSFLEKYIDKDTINYTLNVYYLSLLEYNYSKELEDYIFSIYTNIKDRKLCFRYMEAHYITNINFNQRLFHFLIDNKYIEDNENSHLYKHLFDVLYGKKEFTDLLILLDVISIYDMKRILIENINEKDLLLWFNIVKIEKISSKIISLFIFAILKRYKNLKNKNILKLLFEYIDNNRSYNIRFDISDYEINNNFLNFDDIKSEFWSYYFSQKKSNNYYGHILNLLKIYKVSVNDIIDISITYPIENYIKYYICFRNHILFPIEKIDNFLMQNIQFENHMRRLWKKDEQKFKKEKSEWEEEIEREKKDKLIAYQKALNSFETEEDLKTIYFYFQHEDSSDKMYEILSINLQEKYEDFLKLIYSSFEDDISYLEIKNNLLIRDFPSMSLIFNYYFSSLTVNELENLNLSQENYEKLFWHKLKIGNLDEKYFITISKSHLYQCIKLIVIVLNKFFIQSKYTSISDWMYHYISFFKLLGVYNSKDLKPIIINSKLMITNYQDKLERDKSILIEIIAVDKNNYQFILNLMLKDKKNYVDYFESLLLIDINRAIDDFLNIFYPKEKEDYIIFSTEQIYNFLTPIYQYSSEEVLNIAPKKRKYFKKLVGTIHEMNYYKDFDYVTRLEEKQIEFILKNYYNFFKTSYQSHNFNIYYQMNQVTSKIWTHIEENIKYIGFIESLISKSQDRLHTLAKKSLEKLYNLQLKNREFNNNYYKQILDNYKNKKDRFFNYVKLRDDLIEVSLIETKNRNAIFKESEDETNDRFRNALHYKNYNVTDQARGGESSSGINAGERDLVVCNEQGLDESVIEAFILTSLDSTVINKHYEKLVKRYDTSGNEVNFILVYSKTKNFDELWKKYIEFDGFDSFVDTQDKYSQKDNVRVGISEYKNIKIYHLFINFYSHGKE